MKDLIPSLTEAAKLLLSETKYGLMLLALAATFLLLPESIMGQIGLAGFRSSHGQWIGFALVLSIVVVAVQSLWFAKDWLPKKWAESKKTAERDAKMRKTLAHLNEQQRFILISLVVKEIPYLRLRANSDDVIRLSMGGIIRGGQALDYDGDMETVRWYEIDSRAADYLRKHPELFV